MNKFSKLKKYEYQKFLFVPFPDSIVGNLYELLQEVRNFLNKE